MSRSHPLVRRRRTVQQGGLFTCACGDLALPCGSCLRPFCRSCNGTEKPADWDGKIEGTFCRCPVCGYVTCFGGFQHFGLADGGDDADG